jgi:hypothetical protein
VAIAKRAHELLPDDVRDFLNVTQDQISFWAVFPDKQDKDNIDHGYWMHSRKMSLNKKVHVWNAGSIALVFGATRWNFRTHYLLGNHEAAKEDLLKLFHYCVDACTLPHLVSKDADFLHSKFEEDMGKGIFILTKQISVSNKPLLKPISIYDSSVMLMESIFDEQKEVLIKMYNEGDNINNHNDLKITIIKNCLQCCVDFVSNIYLSISKEDNYKEE